MLYPILSDTLKHPSLRHGFFTRHGGISTGAFNSLNCSLSQDDRQTVMYNRELIGSHLGSHDNLVYIPSLNHTPDTIFLSSETLFQPRSEADGVVTRLPNVAIGVLGADCAPVLLADPVAKVVGAAHAGWRGARNGILDSVIKVMCENGAVVERIVVAIGPCIQWDAYEVGLEFEQKFVQEDQSNERVFKRFRDSGKPHFDLPSYVVHKLHKTGVTRIDNLKVCTVRDDRLFSYRQARKLGRVQHGCQASAIMLTGK